MNAKKMISTLALVMAPGFALAQAAGGDADAAAQLAAAIQQANGGAAVVAPKPEPARPAPARMTPEEQAHVDEESRLMRQIRIARLHAELREALGVKDSPHAGGAAAGDSNAPVVVSRVAAGAPAVAPVAQPVARPVMNADLPFAVTGIWGMENNLTAEIRASGMNVSVRAGDSLPGGWVVDTIARTGILIRKGNATRTVMVTGV